MTEKVLSNCGFIRLQLLYNVPGSVWESTKTNKKQDAAMCAHVVKKTNIYIYVYFWRDKTAPLV